MFGRIGDAAGNLTGVVLNGRPLPLVIVASICFVVTFVVFFLLYNKLQFEGKVIPPAPEGKNIWGSVTLNERGQIVIPKAARDHFGLSEGQRLILLSADGECYVLIPAEWFEERLALLGQIASEK